MWRDNVYHGREGFFTINDNPIKCHVCQGIGETIIQECAHLVWVETCDFCVGEGALEDWVTTIMNPPKKLMKHYNLGYGCQDCGHHSAKCERVVTQEYWHAIKRRVGAK
ncbi:hypothetical protein KAR91_13085 [Candidatus Pacearchaeota archaeon]|nr:hypothetical protein [Candidatus Pacearchaeota archaeon]